MSAAAPIPPPAASQSDDDWTRAAPRAAAAIAILAFSLVALPRAITAAPREAAAIASPAAEASARAAEPARSVLPDLRVNLNTATSDQLRLLPEIGPSLSQRIIEDREANGPFQSLQDLDRVRGIGPRTILDVGPYCEAP